MENVAPLVSIITPVYRSEDILAKAIGSVLAQDLRDWEAVLVDDGSPDQSWRVIQSYAWIDPRIRPIQQKHAGACVARNTGIAAARGKYLLFLDADDWMEPGALSALVQACEKDGWAAAHAGLRYVTPEGSPTCWDGGYAGEMELFDALSRSNVLSVPSAALIRRSVLDDIGVFDPSLVHCGDWDMWARLARNDAPLGRVKEVVTYYRMRPGSLSRNPRNLFRDAITVLRRMHAPDRRVKHPLPHFANGIAGAELPSRIAHFAVYPAGLAASMGRAGAAGAVLDLVEHWPRLSPRVAGEFLFYSLCFAQCCGPEGVAEFWPWVVEPVQRLLADLEDRTGTPGLADDMMHAMDACCERRLADLPLPLPELSDEAAPPPEPPPAQNTLAHNALHFLARRGA